MLSPESIATAKKLAARAHLSLDEWFEQLLEREDERLHVVPRG
jgi:hypothetical protein